MSLLPSRSLFLRTLYDARDATNKAIQGRDSLALELMKFDQANAHRSSIVDEDSPTARVLDFVHYMLGYLAIHNEAARARGHRTWEQQFSVAALIAQVQSQPCVSTITAAWQLKTGALSFASRLTQHLEYLNGHMLLRQGNAFRVFQADLKAILQMLAGDGLGVASFSECVRVCWQHLEVIQHLCDMISDGDDEDGDDHEAVQREIAVRDEFIEDVWQGVVVQGRLAGSPMEGWSFLKFMEERWKHALWMQSQIVQNGEQIKGRQRVLEEFFRT